MKVFISHSSKEKWAARTISRDLANLGVETFLDEKDIETGDPVDDSIQGHLQECDDFLILISPASLGSQWVLVELGGAIALKKRLVPILLYVGSNDIPKPISKHLSRDINEIDRYYDEIKRRIKGEPVEAPKEPVKEKTPPAKESFSVGDRVRIPDSPQPSAKRSGSNINWVESMTKYCGMSAVVAQVDDDRSVILDIDTDNKWWAMEWLRADAR